VAQFRPDVLVMDIEGGELQLLENAALKSLRAIVLEFHPKHYGKQGVTRCQDILCAAGFAPLQDVSTSGVWGAVKRSVP
jgi:hypothetical protein